VAAPPAPIVPAGPGDGPLLTAELLSIGSELTVGDTRDTNAGELAHALTGLGVTVGRITALPDRLAVVADAFAAGLERAHLVISTGGLGPTPDDLTREAIASVCGETPVVDPVLERWLRGMWARRKLSFPESNRKQAWLIPSAVALANPNGTAPGWYVTRPDDRVVIALPGPPREMRPMWQDEALPRLQARPGGVGTDVFARTFRLTGIGESQVAEILGEELLRGGDPEVATYARVEAVDVRVSAIGRPDRSAATAVAATAALVEERLGAFIWATGETTWSEAIAARLAAQRWDLALTEIGTRGQVGALLGDVEWLRRDDVRTDDDLGDGPEARDRALLELARAIRATATTVGVAVAIVETGGDTDVAVAVATPDHELVEHRTAFLGGRMGRSRAALATAALLFAALPAAATTADEPPG
jgi:molybdenum cofactor synthesis domain-containing protein